jgi:NitT/TauT family transport system permease protein
MVPGRRRSRVRRYVTELTYPGLVFVATVAMWEGASRLGVVTPYLLPAPSAILARLIELRAILWSHTVVTALEILLGFVLAIAVGVVLAIAVVYLRPFERAVYPWIVATQAVPKVALAPLLIVWLGFGLLPKVVIAVLIAFFPILIDTVIGLRSVEEQSIFLLQSMGAGRWKTFWYLRLPNALPNIFGGMKVGVILATVGAIVAEFIGANEGLGYLLIFANGILDTRLLFAALTLIAALAVLLYAATNALEKVCIRWHVSVRSGAVTM